jgi:hypothetical protein
LSAVKIFDECAEKEIKAWVESKELLLEDLKHLKLAAVVHYELMASGDTLGLFAVCIKVSWFAASHSYAKFSFISIHSPLGILNALCKHFDIAPIDENMVTITDSSKPDGGKERARRQFHGGRKGSITFDKGFTFAWIDKYRREAISKSPDGCQSVFATYEKAINRFGYSFYNMESVFASPHLSPWLVPPS